MLGRTRDGVSRLPLATDEDPLRGGLRIGKLDASGEDGDGQYFHYLTIWMYALYQMSLASGNATFLKQAISMAKAVHSKFVYNQNSSRPRMYWKMSMDLSEPLVMSEVTAFQSIANSKNRQLTKLANFPFRAIWTQLTAT